MKPRTLMLIMSHAFCAAAASVLVLAAKTSEGWLWALVLFVLAAFIARRSLADTGPKTQSQANQRTRGSHRKKRSRFGSINWRQGLLHGLPGLLASREDNSEPEPAPTSRAKARPRRNARPAARYEDDRTVGITADNRLDLPSETRAPATEVEAVAADVAGNTDHIPAKRGSTTRDRRGATARVRNAQQPARPSHHNSPRPAMTRFKKGVAWALGSKPTTRRD